MIECHSKKLGFFANFYKLSHHCILLEIERDILIKLKKELKTEEIIALVGSRQVEKTTLLKIFMNMRLCLKELLYQIVI